MAEAAPSVVAFKFIQAFLNMGVAFWGVPLLADVEPWDIPDPWLLFGRIVVMVRHAADVFAKSFQGFVDVVGGPWSRGEKMSPIPSRERVPTGTGVFLQRLWSPVLVGRQVKSMVVIRR